MFSYLGLNITAPWRLGYANYFCFWQNTLVSWQWTNNCILLIFTETRWKKSSKPQCYWVENKYFLYNLLRKYTPNITGSLWGYLDPAILSCPCQASRQLTAHFKWIVAYPENSCINRYWNKNTGYFWDQRIAKDVRLIRPLTVGCWPIDVVFREE